MSQTEKFVCSRLRCGELVSSQSQASEHDTALGLMTVPTSATIFNIAPKRELQGLAEITLVMPRMGAMGAECLQVGARHASYGCSLNSVGTLAPTEEYNSPPMTEVKVKNKINEVESVWLDIKTGTGARKTLRNGAFYRAGNLLRDQQVQTQTQTVY